MLNRIYLYDLYGIATISIIKYVPKNPYYDLEMISSPVMREEMTSFIKFRASQISLSTIYGERQHYNKVCSFLQKYPNRFKSFCDQDKNVWLR